MNYENAPSESRNVNAEWAMLKEIAQGGTFSSRSEWEMGEAERERCRRRGKMLLSIINRMPDRMEDEAKTEKLDKIYQVAERAGIKPSMDESLTYKREHLSHEKIGQETFGDNMELTEEELQRVDRLREKVADLTEMAPGALAEEFPSGNYLYHGSTVSKIEKIFRTGGLKNGVALVEDDPEVSAFNMNSGFEGISWSMNGIDALPGTRGHMAGFLSAPENLLGHNQLVVPSRPAPYEVLQIGEKVNPEELYALKTQLETWGDGSISLGEKNNVDSNLMWMLIYKEGDMFAGSSTVYKYEGDMSDTALRKYYTLDEQGNLTWDEDIQQKSEVPPALPWMQSLIDRGIFARNGFEGLDTVQKVVDYAKTDENFIKTLLATERAVAKPLDERYSKMLDDTEAVRVGVDKMYFVTSHKDLDSWLKVMARTGVEPKGILLYDDEQVVMENFASKFEGNHKELSREIGRAVDVDNNFWKDEMGIDPEMAPRSGYRGQVLLESAVRRDKVIRLDKNGGLEVVLVSR